MFDGITILLFQLGDQFVFGLLRTFIPADDTINITHHLFLRRIGQEFQGFDNVPAEAALEGLGVLTDLQFENSILVFDGE